MQFNIGAAERIFGPGGVRVRTQGSAEITMGLKTNKNNDPSFRSVPVNVLSSILTRVCS